MSSELLRSITDDIERTVAKTGTIPRQFMCTTLMNGSPMICRDMSCLGYDGQSMTHRGDIIVHRPLRIDRRTGLLHPKNVSLTFEEDCLDYTTITASSWIAPIPTIPFVLQIFYGLEFSSELIAEEYCFHANDFTLYSSELIAEEYCFHANDFTLYDLVYNKVLTPVSQDKYSLYPEYFVPLF